MRVLIKVKNGGHYCITGDFLEDVVSKMAVQCPLTNQSPYGIVDNNLRTSIYHSLRKNGKAHANLWGGKMVNFVVKEEL